MANQEHLNMLKKGVKVWNQWRQKHRDVPLDLNKADLSGADLRDINLSLVRLREANYNDPV